MLYVITGIIGAIAWLCNHMPDGIEGLTKYVAGFVLIVWICKVGLLRMLWDSFHV